MNWCKGGVFIWIRWMKINFSFIYWATNLPVLQSEKIRSSHINKEFILEESMVLKNTNNLLIFYLYSHIFTKLKLEATFPLRFFFQSQTVLAVQTFVHKFEMYEIKLYRLSITTDANDLQRNIPNSFQLWLNIKFTANQNHIKITFAVREKQNH